jgi:2-dehydro-3-deoxygluconokinase
VSRSLDLITLGEALVQMNAATTGRIRHVQMFEKHAAGSELNTAIAGARLGLATGWIGRLGADELGEFLLASLRAEGVDTSAIVFDNSAPTGMFLVQRGYPLPGDSSSIYYRVDSAGSRFYVEDLDVDYLGRARALHLSGVSLAVSASLREACFEAMETAKASDALISFDVNFRYKLWDVREARPHLERALRCADLVFCGLKDAERIFGASAEEQALEAVSAFGPSQVVLAMGARGALLSVDGSCYRAVPPDIQVIDATGAGDALAATVLSGRLKGWDPQVTLDRACTIGSMVCSVSGDYEGVPTLAELERVMDGSWVAR